MRDRHRCDALRAECPHVIDGVKHKLAQIRKTLPAGVEIVAGYDREDLLLEVVGYRAMPGMHHCGGGPEPNVFDAMVPLVLWVETGANPDSISLLTSKTRPHELR
jgi:Tannase and feruloyl esterase